MKEIVLSFRDGEYAALYQIAQRLRMPVEELIWGLFDCSMDDVTRGGDLRIPEPEALLKLIARVSARWDKDETPSWAVYNTPPANGAS